MSNPISRTAYYTLGGRAWDASRPKPVCGDSFAKVFMDAEAQKVWEEFKDQLMPNLSNASRHAIIDRQLRDALSVAPDAQVVIIGAGFDTRAYRIKGGRWVEVDEPAIINYKESKLPASEASNTLTRIPIEFAKELLTEKLSAFATQATTHIIVEGVLMYLSDEEREHLIKDIQKIFPNHIVYCDLMRQPFFERYGKAVHEKIVALGARFANLSEQPENLFLSNGYKMLSRTSVPLYAAQHGNVGIPPFIVRFFLKTLRDGYRTFRFQYSRRG